MSLTSHSVGAALAAAPPGKKGLFPGRSAVDGRRSLLGGSAGIVLILVLWALMARTQPELILPSPARTWEAFLGLGADGTLFIELARTIYRSATGVLLALVAGVVWGAVNGLSSWAAVISQPALSALMAVPPVVIVALGLIWFGPGDAVTRLVIVLVALPLLVVTVQEAVRNVDRDLVEMATAFGIPRGQVLRQVIAPGIASPVLAATTVTFGQAIRVAVMAELLSATDGVGAEVSVARTNLETADLFAWTAALVVMVIVLETCILRPFTARLLHWRSAPDRSLI